jgi:hypothetical protein
MNFKSQVESLANDFGGQVDHLPERAEKARKVVNDVARDFADRATTMVRQHPGRSLVGAFVVGWLIAKVAKHA